MNELMNEPRRCLNQSFLSLELSSISCFLHCGCLLVVRVRLRLFYNPRLHAFYSSRIPFGSFPLLFSVFLLSMCLCLCVCVSLAPPLSPSPPFANFLTRFSPLKVFPLFRGMSTPRNLAASLESSYVVKIGSRYSLGYHSMRRAWYLRVRALRTCSANSPKKGQGDEECLEDI